MDIKVTLRVEVTDAQGGDFSVTQERSAKFLGNPLFNAAETDKLIDSIQEDLHRVLVARYGEPTRRGSGRG